MRKRLQKFSQKCEKVLVLYGLDSHESDIGKLNLIDKVVINQAPFILELLVLAVFIRDDLNTYLQQ